MLQIISFHRIISLELNLHMDILKWYFQHVNTPSLGKAVGTAYLQPNVIITCFLIIKVNTNDVG